MAKIVVPEGNSHVVLEQIVKPRSREEYFKDSNGEPFCCKLVKTKRKLDNLEIVDMEYEKISLELPQIGKPYGEAEKRVYDAFIEMANLKNAQFLSLELNGRIPVSKLHTDYLYLVKFYNEEN